MDSLRLAVDLHRQGKLNEAEQLYKSIDPQNKNYPDALHLLGMLRHQQGRPDEAETLVKSALQLSDAALYHYNLGIILEKQGKNEEAVTAYKRAIARDSNYSSPHLNLGKLLEDQGELEGARGCYEAVIKLEPKNAVAHSNLGNIFRKKKQIDLAMSLYRKAALLDPSYGEPLFNLGVCFTEQGDYKRAEESFESCLMRAPEHHRAWSSLGLSKLELKNFQDADECFRRAMDLKPDFWDGLWNYSLSRLLNGDFEQGFALFEHRWKRTDAGEERSPIGGHDLTAEALKAGLDEQAKIALYCEQGLGDSIQFIRFLPLLQAKCRNVSLACPKVLEPLLRQNFPQVGFIQTKQEARDTDWRCSLMSLPHVLGIEPERFSENVPYLKADAARKQQWAETLENLCGKKLRVGIVWQGNASSAADRGRSIPLEFFKPLAELPRVQLISLQKNDGTEQISSLDWARCIKDFGPELDKDAAFLDSAAIIENLDLLISSDTSIAHLGGALGVRTWVALRFSADWRWLIDREDTPWYPSMRLFRQSTSGDWAELFQRITTTILQGND